MSSFGLKEFEQQNTQLDPSRAGTFPCPAMNKSHIGYDTCAATTTMPARNRQFCTALSCTSKWRHCRVCVEQGNREAPWVTDAQTGLCAFHTKHGEHAVREKGGVRLMRAPPKLNVVSSYPAPKRPHSLDIPVEEFEGKGTRIHKPEGAMGRSPLAPLSAAPPKQPARFDAEALQLSASRIGLLTEKKLEVLKLIAEGLDIGEAAARLGVTTANTHASVAKIAATLLVPEMPDANKWERAKASRRFITEAYKLYLELPAREEQPEERALPAEPEPPVLSANTEAAPATPAPETVPRKERRSGPKEMGDEGNLDEFRVLRLPALVDGIPDFSNFDFSVVSRLVGKRIRYRRKVLGMTQETLAGRVGLSFQQLQKYERGRNRVSAEILFALSHILRVSPLYFYMPLPMQELDEDEERRRSHALQNEKVEKAVQALDTALQAVRGLKV